MILPDDVGRGVENGCGGGGGGGLGGADLAAD